MAPKAGVGAGLCYRKRVRWPVFVACFASGLGCVELRQPTHERETDGGRTLEESTPGSPASANSADDARAESPRKWVRWPISGELTSLDQFHIRDAAQGSVTSQVTGLTWARDVLPQPMSRTEAERACRASRLDGHEDWSLPTRIELVSLVVYTIPQLIDDEAFPHTPRSFFWTASPVKESSGASWGVDFKTGYVTRGWDAESHYVRCVRAPEASVPAERFVAGRGTVFDKVTNLTWLAAPGERRTLDAAIKFCRLEASEGMGRFRLPSIEELHSIIDEDRAAPALAPPFAAEEAGVTWSATAVQGATEIEWAVDLAAGRTMRLGTESKAAAWCVQ